MEAATTHFQVLTLLISAPVKVILFSFSSSSGVLGLVTVLFVECLVVSRESFRSVDGLKQILSDALLLLLVTRVLVPHRNSVSLVLCSYFYTADLVSSLKLISDESEKQIFPKSV
jgi:hypothetical protein